MRAVAGAILILSATILVSAVLIASRLNTQPTDAGTFNLILIGGAFACSGLFGLMVLLGGMGSDRPPPPDQRPPA